MANICLDAFLNEEKKGITNFDWLDLEPEDYNNLPFHPLPSYMAIPKLEEAWSHTEDSKNLRLVPNMDTNFNTNMPQKDNSQSDIKHIVDFVKKQMMSGKTGKDLVEMVKHKATPELIKQAYSELEKLSKEQGLLGNVYVDPTVFARCSEGAEFTGKMAKTAKYVLAMKKCSGCSHNRCNRCEVYKKKIASEVNYGEDTLDFYSKHFSNLNGKNIKVSSKEELQNLFTYKPEVSQVIASNKPKNEEKNEKTLEQKKMEYDDQLEDLKKSLSGVAESVVGKDISSLIIKGYDSKTICKHIKAKYSSEEFEKSKEYINQILAKQGSFGKVFVEASLLLVDDSQDERNITSSVKGFPNVKYVVIPEESLKYNKLREVCRKTGKEVVSSFKMIPARAWEQEFNKYSTEIKEKIGSIFKENPIKGLRLSFIQSNTFKKEAIELDGYKLTSNLDQTEYSPENKKISLTPGKVKAALEKGYTLSSIIHTGRQLGCQDKDISLNIKKAFENVKELHKYQLNVPFTIPSNIKVILSQKDINADLSKSLDNLPSFAFNSFDAPIDTFVNDMGVMASELNLDDVKETKLADLNVTGLDEFTIS